MILFWQEEITIETNICDDQWREYHSSICYQGFRNTIETSSYSHLIRNVRDEQQGEHESRKYEDL